MASCRHSQMHVNTFLELIWEHGAWPGWAVIVTVQPKGVSIVVSDTGLCAQQGLVMARGSIPLVCEGSSHLVWFPCALQAISNKNGHVHCPSKEHRQICFAQPAMSFINESVHVDAYDLWGRA